MTKFCLIFLRAVPNFVWTLGFAVLLFGACAPSSAQTFNATLPALTITAPVYTITPTFTPSPTSTDTLRTDYHAVTDGYGDLYAAADFHTCRKH